MATSSPRLSHKASMVKSTVMNIAVVGLTSSSQGDQGEGSGKSCLCNRFMVPHADHYFVNHPYIVNLSEFGNSVINNCHFLYWGDKVIALEDTTEVRFRIVEHTEFVEDMSLKPFSAQKPYHKRITVTKLQSGGKLQYVEPNQLTLPDDYPNVNRFPDRSVTVDGFVMCVDVSADFSPDSRYRSDALKLITIIQTTKKPVVIALTKCDRVTAPKISEVSELLGRVKRAPPQIEVSAHEGINIDMCFLVLAHMVDSRKPKIPMISYLEALGHYKERRMKNEKLFKTLLERRLTDFTMSKSEAAALVKREPEWEGVAQLLGSPRCEKLVNVRLGQLHMEVVMRQTKIFKELLPGYFVKLLPHVTLECTVESCLEQLKAHDEFDTYFVRITNWTDDIEFLYKFSDKVPIVFVEKEGRNLVQEHVNALQLEIKRDNAKEKIREMLQSTDDLQPGVKAMVAMETLGLREEAEMLEPDALQKVYQERMNVIEQKCSDDIHELLLERLDLFHDYTPDPREITEKLMDEPCMKKMELALTRRNGIIVKHISTLEVLERGPYFKPKIMELLETTTPSLTSVQDSIAAHWSSTTDCETLNLILASKSSEEAAILKSDVMNQCTGADMYEFGNRSHQLRMKCCHSGNEEMTTEKFMPHGIIGIISSMERLEWIGSFLSCNFLTTPTNHYRGMPCILVAITEDTSNECTLLQQCKQLAVQLQCVLVSTPPTDLPGRLIPPEIVNMVLPSLYDNLTLTHSFLHNGPVCELEGLNFGVFSLPGDPCVPAHLQSLLNSPQLAHYNKKSKVYFTKTALERQHKVVSLSLYSTINASDFGTTPLLGFMIFYSCDRKASLSAVKWLVPRLHPIPILLVAVGNDHSAPLIEQGRVYAKERGEKVEFITCHTSQISAARLSKFYSDCFFSRFTSWKNQGLSEEVSAKILKRRAPNKSRPLPLPSGERSQTISHSLSRHSVALGDYGPPKQFATISGRSVKYKKPMPAVSHSDDELDDSMYSDPNEIMKKFTQPIKSSPSTSKYNSTPEISRSSTGVPAKSPGPAKDRFNTLPHTSSLSEYAMVPSTGTLGKLDTLTRKRRAGHETSPTRHTSTPDSTHISDESLYSPVRETAPQPLIRRRISHDHTPSIETLSPSPPPVYPKTQLYDHLTPRSQRKLMLQQKGGQPIGEGGEDLYSIAGESSPRVDHTYSTFNSTQIELGQLQNQLNFVTETIGGPRPPPEPRPSHKRPSSPVGIYNFCEEPSNEGAGPGPLSLQSYNVKTVDGSPTPQRRLPPRPDSSEGNTLYDYATLPQYSLQTQSHEGTPEAMYSLAEDTPTVPPRPTTPTGQFPLTVRRDATPPPVIPPRPTLNNNDLLTNHRTTPRTTPILTRAIEHVIAADDAIYAIPDKTRPKPNIEHVIAADDAIYAIPDKTRPKPNIQHVIPADNPDAIYAIPDKPKKLLTSQDTLDDDDDDEAPPLPDRNYDYSDIEDDDEECLHSDDEEEDMVSKPAPAPIGIYDCIGEEATPTSSSANDPTEMEQIESIYMNLNILRKQQELRQKQLQIAYEEPIYDSLEKVIEVVNKGSVDQSLEPMPKVAGGTPLPITKMPTGGSMPPLSKKTIKLLKKIEKKAQKEKEQRMKQDAKRMKKEEEKRKKMEKALKKGKKIKQPIRRRYFESPLSSIVAEDGVPALIKACVEIVERDGLDSVGLYRISGKREDILKVQDMYDHDPNVDINTLDVCVNAITGILKTFFKVLPDPLIPEKLLTPLLDIPGSDDITCQMKNMSEMLSTLPRANLNTLRFVCHHLHKIQQNHEVNKMSASNLSIVFWPTLMRPPIMDMANPTKQLGWQLAMAKMIEHPECVPVID